ncbi:MAG: ATP-binding protein [Promethearchaeota archaeon]
MCKWCMKHGAGGKWYMNAKNYSDQLAKDLNAEEYLTEQWRNIEQIFIRKIFGFSTIGLGYKLKMPLIGRIIRSRAEKMIHSEKKNRVAVRSEGHFGQAIPLEDAKIIISELAAEPIIQNYCVCRLMQRGIKDACCINFGVLSGIIEKLPRFIPENTKIRLDRDEAIAEIEKHNKNGKIATVWFQPLPYISAICSCETPHCSGLRLRTDFGLHVVYKAEYVIQLDQNECQACKACIAMCQFGAINYSPTLKRVIVDQNKCFGCGLCRHACKHDALRLMPREEHPILKNKF